MIPRLNKFKNINFILFFCLFLLFVSFSVPAIRGPSLNILKLPLVFFTSIQREFGAVIFYHRNFTQNERLQKQVQWLRNNLNTQEELRLENLRLKNLLSFKQKSPYQLVAARVIGRSADAWSSSIIVDKGKHSGIRNGASVINYLGFVGRVIEVADSTSKILLISDPTLSISSLVQRSRQEGLVSGTLGNYLMMRYLPEDADIKIEDVIVSSGLNQTYPKGLLIGTVVEISKEFSGLSRYAMIKPAMNLSNLEEVLVIMQ